MLINRSGLCSIDRGFEKLMNLFCNPKVAERYTGERKMKMAIGLMLALVIGALCRLGEIPVPAPPAIMGALLVFSMTSGYALAGRFAGKASSREQQSGGTP